MIGASVLAMLAAAWLGMSRVSPDPILIGTGGCEDPSRPPQQTYALERVSSGRTSRLKLRLNLPGYRLELFQDDSLIRHYIVAIGDTAYPTPIGSFTVTRVDWDPWWIPPASEWAQKDSVTPPGPRNPMGRVRLAFREMYFIHGTPYPHSVGSPASHGCVRLSNTNAIDLARRVIAMNAPGVSPALVNQLAAKRGKTSHSIALELPVPLEIRYELTTVRDGKLTIYPDVYHRYPGGMFVDTVVAAFQRAVGDSVALDTSQVRATISRVGAKTVTVELTRLQSPAKRRLGEP
jgi:hypothetical protein